MNNYYVYTHEDIDGNVFYIGKGKKKRAWEKQHRSKVWKDKVKSIGTYEIKIPYDNLSQDEALDCEAMLIELHGIENLVNIKKETPKEKRGTLYYKILQQAKDYKVLMEIHDNFDYYWKIPYFKKHIQSIHFVQQLQDEIKLL